MDAPTFLGSNINLVKSHNLRAILLSLLYEGQVSRVELAKKTALSTTTITNLTGELLEQGIIVEESSPEIERVRRVGRPRTMLQLVPDARYAVGVHIGVGIFRIAVANLCAEIIHNSIYSFDLSTPADAVLDQITAAANKLIMESGLDRQRILGVGVGASGLVDFNTGVNILAPRLDWQNILIQSSIERGVGLPVCVENNVRTMALGEEFFGAGRGAKVLAFVYGRIGVGAGIVVDGRIFRGSGAGAGEIGHMIMIPEGGDRCQCGQTGCLETLISEPVLIREAENLAIGAPDSLLADYMRLNDHQRPIERIFAAARAGDEGAVGLIRDRSRFLGIALANLVNILNPELILLGGMFAEADDLFMPTAERVMREMAFGDLGEKVRLQPTTFGWKAGVVGASSLALSNYFYQRPEEI
jgi:glucokinase-like ROK family protein